MVHKQMKRCSSPLAKGKMQKKTILRYYHIPIRMAEIKHTHTHKTIQSSFGNKVKQLGCSLLFGSLITLFIFLRSTYLRMT